VTFVLKDGEHVIEINMDGFCFHEIITVSGAAEAVLYVEDLFLSYYGWVFLSLYVQPEHRGPLSLSQGLSL
jgi:hypothetical protein